MNAFTRQTPSQIATISSEFTLVIQTKYPTNERSDHFSPIMCIPNNYKL